MRRRAASVVAVLLAAACAGEVIALSAHLREERQRESARYREAREALAQRAGRATEAPAARAGGDRLCLRGVETAAVALADEAKTGVVGRRGRLDPDALADLSARASQVERQLERAGGLPQRLGRERAPSGAWRALEPETVRCEGGAASAIASAPPHGVSSRSGAK